MSRDIVSLVIAFLSNMFSGESISLGDGLSFDTYGLKKGFVTLNVTYITDVLWSLRIELNDVEKLFRMLLNEERHIVSVICYNNTYFWSVKEGSCIFLRIGNVSQRKDMYLIREDVLQAHLKYVNRISNLRTA